MSGLDGVKKPSPSVAWLSGGLTLAVLAWTAWVQWRYAVVPVASFDWLAYLDSDTIYQVERFLVNMAWPGVDEIVSSPSDYGSEFSLLIPAFRLVARMSSSPAPLLAYRFLTGVHLACALAALWVLAGLVARRTATALAGPAFTLVVVTSPLFVQYMAFLKPDANVVLLCLVLGLWSLDRFERDSGEAWFAACCCFAGLGAAVKWWGLFLVPALAYVAYGRRYDLHLARRLHAFAAACTAGLLFLGATLFLANPAMLALFDLVLRVLAGQERLSAQAIRTALQWSDTAHISPGTAAWGLGALLVLAGLATGRVLLARRERLLGRVRASRVAACLWSLWSACAGFGFFALLFDAPFFLTSQLFYSTSRYSNFALGVQPVPQGLLGSLLANAAGWLTDVLASGLASPFLLSALFATALWYPLVRNKRPATAVATIWLVVGSLTAFLFFLVTKKNGATQAMLLPLAVFAVFATLGSPAVRSTRGRGARLLLSLLCLGALAQSAWNLALGAPSLATWPRARQGLAQEVERLNTELLARLDAGQTGFVLVNRDFPQEGRDPRLRRTVCETLDPATPPALSPGQILVVSTLMLPEGVGTLLSGLVPLTPLAGKRFLRDGAVQEAPLFALYALPGDTRSEP